MMNMYRAKRGKADLPSALLRRTRVGVRFSRTAVSDVNQDRAKRGKADLPSRLMARTRTNAKRVGVRFSRNAVSAIT